MNISLTKVGGFDVVTLKGEFLTEPEQNEFRTTVKGIVANGARHVIVNMGEIRHVNSCALGSMVCAMVMLKKNGGDVRFVGVNRDVAKILEITHLDRVFRVYPGLAEATGDHFALQN